MNRFPLLGKALRSIALRWVLFVLLLLAQQAALTHALSHASGHTHGPVAVIHHDHGPDCDAHAHAGEDHHGPGNQAASEFCAFDLVYSQVLGAALVDQALFFAATDQFDHADFSTHWRVVQVSLPYDSRAPPAFS